MKFFSVIQSILAIQNIVKYEMPTISSCILAEGNEFVRKMGSICFILLKNEIFLNIITSMHYSLKYDNIQIVFPCGIFIGFCVNEM